LVLLRHAVRGVRDGEFRRDPAAVQKGYEGQLSALEEIQASTVCMRSMSAIFAFVAS